MRKHKWRKVESDNLAIETHVCTVCDCERRLVFIGGKYPTEHHYTRCQVDYMTRRPECYEKDWEHGMGHFN